MIRTGLWTLGLLAYASFAVPGCGLEPNGLDDDAADEEVNLDSMLSVAGAADISHGTQAYRAPAGAPQDEREERLFVAFLSGGQEVPAVSTKAEGAMALLLNKKQDRLRFVLQHQVEGATVAHLHLGSAGENGPVAVALPRVDHLSAGNLSITPEQAAALLAGRLYVNVHSATNTKGEIRGQILRPGETVFVATLSGAQEVPPVSTMAAAQATLILGANRDVVRYRITATGITPTLAHVHRGIAGTNGPVVKPLNAPAGTVAEGTFPVTAADLEDLSLRRWYVNLHSIANSKGELRGQVLRPGEALFAATLTGAQEVPPVASEATGNAMVVVGSAGAKFLFVLTTTATPTVAHIHRAPAGSNGPVEVPLEPAAQEMSGIRDLGPDRRADLTAGLWYVNVHTAANTKGELRGQLLAPGAQTAPVAPAPPQSPPADTHQH